MHYFVDQTAVLAIFTVWIVKKYKINGKLKSLNFTKQYFCKVNTFTFARKFINVMGKLSFYGICIK